MKVYAIIRQYMDCHGHWNINQLVTSNSPIPGGIEFDISEDQELFYDGDLIQIINKEP